MDPEKVQARLQPRSPWQAMDLGARMFRQWWRPLLGTWLLFTLVPFTLLFLLTDPEDFFLASLAFWFLKPLWEKPLLEYCGRALFGERPTPLQLLREFPRYGFSGLASLLTLRRLSPFRSFNMPVFQLERSRGEQLARRLRVLHLPPSNRAGALTVLVIHIEQALVFAVLLLIYMLAPWQFNLELTDWLMMRERTHQMIMAISWYLALCLTEPLYVSCGFALYLNKRSWLEAWDLDLGLRRIGRRRAALRSGALALALALPLWFAAPAEAAAGDEAAPREQAVEIVAGPDFMPMRVERRWQQRQWWQEPDWLKRLWDWWPEDDSDEPGTTLDWPLLADAVRFLLAVIVISLLVWLIWRYRSLLRGLATGTRRESLPTTVAGLDIRAESLPDDIGAAVREAVQRGDAREALGLLYRAGLSRLVHSQPLPLQPGTTESECLALLRRRLKPSDPRLDLMEHLTPLWVRVAWAHRRPADADILDCLAGWQAAFPEPPEDCHASA